MNLHRLKEYIDHKYVPDNEVQEVNSALRLIELASENAHPERITMGEVDFSKFTLKDVQAALDHIVYYTADEGLSEPHEDNRSNYWMELNRIAHLNQQITRAVPQKKKKSRFI